LGKWDTAGETGKKHGSKNIKEFILVKEFTKMEWEKADLLGCH
jgi:hypothetical protein